MNHAHERADELDHLTKLYIKGFLAAVGGIQLRRERWNLEPDHRLEADVATTLAKLELRYRVGAWHAERIAAPGIAEAWREARDAFEAYRAESASLAGTIRNATFEALHAATHRFGEAFTEHVRSTYEYETLAERTITDINGERRNLDRALHQLAPPTTER